MCIFAYIKSFSYICVLKKGLTMITALVQTEVRIFDVRCPDNKENAISALQNSVNQLNPEDGRCRFVVLNDGTEIYSWNYQPTFRKEVKRVKKERPVSPYILSLCVYVLLRGQELNYDNLYHEAEIFDNVAEAHQFMKERGWTKRDYHIVYEYVVDGVDEDCIYGTGLGLTKAEAKESLNKSLAYYCLELKNGKILEL